MGYHGEHGIDAAVERDHFETGVMLVAFAVEASAVEIEDIGNLFAAVVPAAFGREGGKKLGNYRVGAVACAAGEK